MIPTISALMGVNCTSAKSKSFLLYNDFEMINDRSKLLLQLRICEKVTVTAFAVAIDSTIFKVKCLRKKQVLDCQCLSVSHH